MPTPFRRTVRRIIAWGLPLLAVGALAVSVWSSLNRNADTRDELKRMCAYIHQGTAQGNIRAEGLVTVGVALGKFLETAADIRERSALTEDPIRARLDIEAAADYRAQKTALERRLRTVHTRTPIRCPQ